MIDQLISNVALRLIELSDKNVLKSEGIFYLRFH
jgi:hypothetical protein